jgi:hypothetical protein
LYPAEIHVFSWWVGPLLCFLHSNGVSPTFILFWSFQLESEREGGRPCARITIFSESWTEIFKS